MTRQRIHARHPDRECRSPDGRLSLSSRHHRSVGQWGMHRASLTMRAGEQVVWDLPRGLRAGSPQTMWVDNSGVSAVLYGDDTLVVVEPAGSAAASIEILKQIANDKRSQEFICRTTAGYYWDKAPIGAFAEVRGRLVFSLRSYWGARVVVGTDGDGDIVTDMDDDERESIRQAESAAAMALLERADSSTERALEQLRAAVLVGVERVREAVPLLRQACGWTPCTHYSTSMGGVRLANGKFGYLGYQVYGLRILCGAALLRLGELPTEHAPFGMAWDGADYERRDRPSDWQERMSVLHTGMSHAEVWELLGAPGFVATGEGGWWYDRLRDSVRVRFARGVVSDIQADQKRPWLDEFIRERRLLR